LAEPIDDAGIPTLAAVLDPVQLRKSLAPVLPAEWGETGDVRVKVLKHHRGKRCTVEIGLETTHGFRELIGKVYSKDRSYVYDFMDSLRRRNFDGKDEFSIPRPFAFLKPLRLLLQEKVQGPRAQEFFLTAGDRERGAAAERCARWLARFHALAPTTGPVFAFSDHMRKMWKYSRFIAERSGGLGAKATRLLERLQSRAFVLCSPEMCGVHGDYVPRNVILCESRTVAYDWDRFSLSDPSRDLASFTVSFQRLALHHLGSITALDSEAEVFEKTYLAAGRPVVAARLRFFKASMCLHFARNILSNQKRHWSEHAEAMLDQGFRFLERRGKMCFGAI
jgi:hypothetical protein